LSESQARTQLVDVQKQSAAEMERLLPTMEKAATAIGPESVARVAAWRNELQRTRLVVDDVAVAINTKVEGAFAQMFESLATGAATASEAFSQFARSVLQAIAQIAAQKLAQSLFSTAGGAGGAGGGGGGGLGGFVSALFAAGFARGGYVSGPGTSTSDSIPARLSAGEYVVRAAAVRRVGVGLLESINGMARGPRVHQGRLAFADGGLVPQAAAQAQVNQSVRIVNSVDPGLIHDQLQTPAGERVIVNVIGRNSRAIRAALGN
jgi:phage-related minor tail protein